MTTTVPTLVIVDDAPDVRLVLRTRLRLDGRVTVVGEGANGREAVDLAAQHQPTLMLLDVSMPELDGLAALPEVLEVSPATQVVLFSGFEEEGMVERARSLGAADFVEKSVPLDQLVGRLLDLAGQSAGRADSTPAPGPPNEPAESKVLGEHLERFREVFDEAAIGMATLTLTGRLVRVNRAMTGLVRRAEEDLVGQFYTGLAVGAEDLVEVALDEIRTGQKDVAHLEHAIAGARAGLRVRATLAAVRDSSGRALYVFMQLQDVTAEQAALEELRRSEERFRLLVEAVEDYAIFMLDPTGHIVSWNPGAQRSELYTAEEIIGQHFRVFYPPELQASKHPEHELEEALREGHYEEEGWRIRKDGSRFWANVLITAVFNADGRHLGFAKVTRDTTERRRLETERESAVEALGTAKTELESLNAQLTRAADEQAQSLAVAAHEMRTPIALLAGSAEMLARHRGKLTDEEQDDLLATMSSGAARLRRLVNDLLTVSKLEASALEMHLEQVSLGEVVAAAITTVQAAEPQAVLRVDGAVDVTVDGDRDRLAQMLENLLRNALQHGSPPVTVSLDPGAPDGTGDGVARLRVSDAGGGVPESLRPRLFQRFATGPARGGTGLGLYIVRQLARAQHGDATYEPPTADTPSGAFLLTLPRSRPRGEPGSRV